MDEDLARRVASLHRSPMVVPWPSRRERRDEAARAGAPCLLVIEPGATPPPVGAHEDWILAGASERDVAARLTTLVERVRAATSQHVPGAVPEWPASIDGLSGEDARVARTLTGRSGRLVRWGDLAADGRDGSARRVVERLRGPLRDAGWMVSRVGSSGVMVTKRSIR